MFYPSEEIGVGRLDGDKHPEAKPHRRSCGGEKETEPYADEWLLAHHFALSVPDEDALARWRDFLDASGVATTEIRDHAYFRSISIHDPDGHIIEIATDTPGLATEET